MSKPQKETESSPSGAPWYSDLESAYTTLRPVFLRTLAQLARQGFAAHPEEAVDLVHDFFLTEYAGLVQRFDEGISKFRTYATRAFIYFARRRIVQLSVWRSTLMDAHTLSRLARSTETQHEHAMPNDAALTEAWSRVPEAAAEVLRSYLSLSAPSERKVADQLKMTRYAVREGIADALAHISVALGEQGQIAAHDWPVALALWRDNCTVSQTAHRLGRPLQEIHTARQRILRTLATALARVSRGHQQPSKQKEVCQ